MRTPAWTNPCCCSSEGTTLIRVSHQPRPKDINSIPKERTNRASSKIRLIKFPFASFISAQPYSRELYHVEHLRRMRTHVAPKPLSILTTAVPDLGNQPM